MSASAQQDSGPPSIKVETSALDTPQTSPGGSPSGGSPASLAPSAGPASELSRPVSPSVQLSRTTSFRSKMAGDKIPSPLSYHERSCVRTGSLISSAWGDSGVPIGVQMYSHVPPNRSKMPIIDSPSVKITAALIAGPTLLIKDRPYILTAAPLSEKAWRDTSQAIATQYEKQTKKMKSSKAHQSINIQGKGLNSLRAYSPGIVDALARSLSPASAHGVASPISLEKKCVGSVWLCSMGCEGATSRKRDWALVQLDNESSWRNNVVVINNTKMELKAPSRSGAKSGTKVVIAKPNFAIGRVGERANCMFGYSVVQQITLEEGSFENGDAGASIVDAETGHYYGMLVMGSGHEAKKGEDSGRYTSKEGWFVPYDIITADIGGTYPLEEIVFGHSDE